jgi:DNA-binding SARP family transcriptional activator
METAPEATAVPGSWVLSDALPSPDRTRTVHRTVAGSDADLSGDGSMARHLVAWRETLWSIAEDRLGDARRWREIAELNYAVVQPDGTRLTADHWILPGWELLLPTPGAQEGVRGETLPIGASGHLLDRHAAPRSVPELAPSPVPDSTPTRQHAHLDRHPLREVPVAPIGAGIVGVGVSDLVDRLRRVQQRHRKLGGRIRLAAPMLRTFEQRLRVGHGRDELDMVEAAIEACVAAMGPEPTSCRLQEVSVTAAHVRLTFDMPPVLVEWGPFASHGDPVTLEVQRAALEPIGGRRRVSRNSFWAPTLVTVGRTKDELIMVNLEGVGSVVLSGQSHANESVGRAMALELATSRWSAAFDLVLIGFGTGMERCERVAVTAEAGPVVADLSWLRLTTGLRLDEEDVTRVDGARRLANASSWQPTVVVCGPDVRSGDIESMVAAAEDGRFGIGIVVIGGPGVPPFDGAVVIRTDSDCSGGMTDVLGSPLSVQRLTDQELGQIEAVLDAAAALDGKDDPLDVISAEWPDPADPDMTDADATAPPVAGTERTTIRIDDRADGKRSVEVFSGTERPDDDDRARRRSADVTEVEVAVLGPVEIYGAARGFTRAWAKELVVYLAVHPGGTLNETWATALWPERLMAPSSLHSTVSVARRSLGTARDGTDHLPRSHGRLALAASVGTDWSRFQALAASDDLEDWCRALTLVRGRPFEGMRATDWSILDGTAPAIESAVVDLSGRLAGARLRAGDTQGAEWSARQGLLVSPYDERLYRMLLRAADAAGNPGGVESVMSDLVRVVADEVEPIESVHPSTLALYRSLSRRPNRALRPQVLS